MPIYEYRCAACGHQDEHLQKVSDAPLTVCPVCGKDLNREPHTHADETSDPRWSALEELRDRL